MTREQWATRFLRGVEAPVTKRNLLVIVSWIQAEGGTAKWNPLNTTHDAPGAWDYNWVGVKNYPTFEVGLGATVETLNYGADRNLHGYRPIRYRLRNNMGSIRTLRKVERSDWGTGGLALLCLPWVKLRWKHYRNLPIND